MRWLLPVRARTSLFSAAGFSFIEVLALLTIVVILLGALFGLLAQSSRASTEELERTDLQAQARAALQRISDDVLLAGRNLPPEFPSIRPLENPGPRATSATGMEVLGDFDDVGAEGAIPVVSFDGRLARLGADRVRLQKGDLVIVYDDAPTDGRWMFGLVEEVLTGTPAEILLVTGPGATVRDARASIMITLPATIDSYNRPLPESGFVTPITVIGYGLEADDERAIARPSLWRQVNWGDRVDVAYVEALDVHYFVRASVFGQDGRVQNVGLPGERMSDPNGETELTSPPVPHPELSRPLDEGALIRGVRISVTSRSTSANLLGATLREGEELTDEGFLRQTLSTRVTPRNILIQSDRRRQELEAEAAREQASTITETALAPIENAVRLRPRDP
jgi:type II secretory pathway pseudopilin PulG